VLAGERDVELMAVGVFSLLLALGVTVIRLPASTSKPLIPFKLNWRESTSSVLLAEKGLLAAAPVAAAAAAAEGRAADGNQGVEGGRQLSKIFWRSAIGYR